MAAKPGLKPEMALLEEGAIFIEPQVPLVLEEREKLRAMFSDPVFVKAWKNARHVAPGPLLTGLNTELGAVIANNRIHEMRGWEMFRAALVGQVSNPPPARSKVEETYAPGSDAIVREPRKKVPPAKPLFPKH